MRNRQGRCPPQRSYRQSKAPLLITGAMVLAAGLLLLFLCIPGWAWAALLGCMLVIVGILLIRLGGR